MAILIQDMEIPESCADCRFWQFDRLSPGCSVALCVTCSQVIPDEDKERPDWCPLKPVSAIANDDRLILELREYAASYRSGETLGRMIEDTEVLLEEAANRLLAYKEAEREERLICLPCKAGDTLWTFELSPAKRVYSLEVLSVTIVNGEVSILADKPIEGNPLLAGKPVEVYECDIGETVFLNRASTECALNHMGTAPRANAQGSHRPDNPESGIGTDNGAKDAEGVCLMCGGNVTYTGEHEFDDSGGKYGWKCPHCGASGEEGYNRTFDRHYNVTDKDGNPIPGRAE